MERDMSVPAFPRSLSRESSACCPRRREGVLGLVVGKRSRCRTAGPGRNSGPVARQVSPSPCAERRSPAAKRHEGTIGQGSVLQSEEGVWAEGRPFLCIWAQGDSSSLATCPEGRRGLATKLPVLNSQKDLQEERAIRCRLHPGCGSLGGSRGCPGETGTISHYSPSQGMGGVQ